MGRINVSNGQTKSGLEISTDSMYISYGGKAIDTVVYFKGICGVLDGGMATNTTVSDGGWQAIYSGGKATSTTVASGGTLSIEEAGMALEILENGGMVYVDDGAKVSFVPNTISNMVLSSSTRASLHSGTTANSNSINDDGWLHVFAGGIANNTVVNDGWLELSGGVANSTTIKGGCLRVYSGGTANDTKVSGGILAARAGGTVNSATISGGSLAVWSGGVANDVILSGGSVGVGGALNNLTVHSGCIASVYNEGTVVNSATISSGGTMLIEYGGTANDFQVRSGGELTVYMGGILSRGTVNSGASATIRNGAVSASDFVVYGDLTVFLGGRVDGAQINTGARVTITSYGTLMNATVTSAEVAAKSFANISGVTMNSGGILNVMSGANILNTTVSSGGVVTGVLRNADLTFSGGTLDLNIAKGAAIDDFLVDAASYNAMTGLSSVTLTIANKQLNGTYKLIRSATDFNTTVTVKFAGNNLGTLTVGGGPTHVGNITCDLKLSGGDLVVFVTGGAVPEPIHSGDILINERLKITSGMSAIDVTVSSGGILAVYSGGVASNTTVYDGGEFHVLSNGDLTGATIYSGGTATVGEDVMARDVVVDGGVFVLEHGGWAYRTSKGSTVSSNTIVKNGGSAIVHESAFLVGAVVSDGGQVEVMSEGTFTNATVTSGTVSACDGGFVSSLYLEDGGILTVESGGTAGCTVSSGGVIRLEDGCDLHELKVYEGGVVTGVMHGIYQVVKMYGGTLDLDISGVAPSNEYLFDNDANIEFDHGGICTLTVDGNQADGTYNLMEFAYGFDTQVITAESPLTVKSTNGSTLGTLTVGGTATIDGVTYTLNLSNDYHLTVTVSGGAPAPTPPPVPGDKSFFTGDFNGDLFDTLAVQKDGTVTIYQNGEAWGLGLTLDSGWSVVGTGDFNGDNIDDFLRVNTEGYVVGEMSNGNGTFTPQVLNLKNAGWDILGTGNFDGVGADDVLIANPTAASETVGLLGYWKGGTEWTLINGYSPEWTMVSTGDFNGDGKCDMLWKNEFIGEGGLTYNAYCTWIVEDPVDWRMVSVANPDEWNFLCSGDFDGNGSHDIAMINDVGVVGIWGVSDGYLSSWSILSAVTSEWQLAGVADFNADGTDDIAWSNTDTGLTGYWQINNKELTTWANIATIG